MSKFLQVFGDSWPYGAELGIQCNTHSFPVLMANILNFDAVVNQSVPATSIDHAVMAFMNFCAEVKIQQYQNRKYTILFCLTGFSRYLAYKNSQWMELHPMRPDPESVNYYKYVHSDQHASHRAIKNILTVHGLCKSMDFDCYFVSNWDKVPDHVLLQDVPIYHKTLCEILDLPLGLQTFRFSKSKYISPNQSHPNVSGHELIAATLSEWLASHA